MTNNSWYNRASNVLPTGASTGSKRADALYGGDPPYGPTHFKRASGCRVETADGRELIDCTMALGSVALGYADPRVTQAVSQVVASGNVAGLSHVLEVELAERLCEVIPGAEAARFLKTGGEGVAAAVRLARAYTGRDALIACGYFGWLDWSSNEAGVPQPVTDMVTLIPFDDVTSLDEAVNELDSDLAAIVIEPVIERLPSLEWIRRTRDVCDARGAVLIFDELKTGFRLTTAGYQEYSSITPDLSVFGKALANGFPLSVVCGRKDLMDTAKRTWISSTLAGEATALAAAGAVLDIHATSDVCGGLARIGSEMRQRANSAIGDSGLAGVTTNGIDQMWLLRFDRDESETAFLLAAVEHGVLFKRGAYNFAALAHDDALDSIGAAAANAFDAVRHTQATST
ncbi:MAG: aminotransferase class III-fold pyridoxal phosphate-dependent enzyme [Gemmatimonadales bacterium]